MPAVPTRPQHWPPQPPRPPANAAAIVAAVLAALAVLGLGLGMHTLPPVIGFVAVLAALLGHEVSRRTGRGMRLSLAALIVGLLLVAAAFAG